LKKGVTKIGVRKSVSVHLKNELTPIFILACGDFGKRLRPPVPIVGKKAHPSLPGGEIMFARQRSFATALLVTILMAMNLFVLTPSFVRAETTAHKAKKKLHTAERVAGVVLCGGGQVMAEVLSHVTVGICVDLEEEEGRAATPASRKVSAPNASTAHASKPVHPASEHPVK
jgi:hypothetical protein